ncbi:proton-conducting transporter membrane subunit [Saccharothrix saharensis]|uniref:proton-conducting transporter transmembrane domain-containing protein n=1 Tax=Saccharothrix saharensis TaxID=571190 RepID=UPI003685A1EC
MVLWSLVSLPLVVGAALALTGRRADRVAPAAGVVVAVALVALAAAAAATRPTATAPLLDGLGVGLAVDGLSAVMVLTVALVLLAVLVFARDEAGGRFSGLMLLFAGAMLVTVTATNLVTLLMAWEVMGATSYALIGFRWREANRVSSGAVAFLTTRAADLGLYLAAGAALAGGSTLALADLAEVTGGWRDAVAAGLVLAAMGKSAQLPFSFWLSRAMDGPSPVSALLHSATMVAAGAYLLLRIEPLLSATGWAAVVVAWIGAGTALLMGAVAVVQRDLKQLLAASTCSQVGFMVLAAGVGGVSAGVHQLEAHAAAKSLLFLCAGAWLASLGTKNLAALRGAGPRHPVVGLSFAVGALALAGLPPLAIWFAKDAVLGAALGRSVALYVVALAAAATSALYAGRALFLVYGSRSAAAALDDEEQGTRVVSRWQQWPLPLLAAAAAGLGAGFGFGEVAWWEPVVSGLIVVLALGVAAAAVHAGRDRLADRAALLTGWLRLEAAARLLVARPALASARWLARFDDRVVDLGVRGAAGLAVRFARGLGRADDRVVDGGVRAVAALGVLVARLTDTRVEWSVDRLVQGVAAWARRLGRLARRPQTGQLHHYYAQAVVALAVLMALVIALGRG